MAKNDVQLDLIDVDDPKFKAVRKQITEYEALKQENKEQHQANTAAEKAKRTKVFEAITGSDLKPDADGVYHFLFSGVEWTVSQDSQLKIHKRKAPQDEAPSGKSGENPDHIEEGNEPDPVSRKR